MTPKISISIDRGGTFTDVHATVPGSDDIILKLLSVDPANYADAPTEGIRRVLERVTGQVHPRGELLQLQDIDRIRMGTTVGTNALLERKGARSALLVTKGFADLLQIADQTRPNIFDLSAQRPGVLYEHVAEIEERVTLEDYTENPDEQRPITDLQTDPDHLRQGITGEVVRILQPPNMCDTRRKLQQIWNQGIRSVAIVFLHSYLYPQHEQLVAEEARNMGFSVVESSALQPMIRAVPRGMAAMVDAYLTPVIKEYIDSVSESFQGGLGASGSRCEFMQSDGGLVDFRQFSGLKSILSGPAGGVVGYAQTTYDGNGDRKPVIGFDMGGTSTDCSRYGGQYEHSFETTLAGVTIQSPQLDIKTVAAGGGSLLTWQNGLFAVGPESAGAHPGPACYRKGGPLTVTDANLFLGRIHPSYFPRIFGPNEDQELGVDITRSKFQALTDEINRDLTTQDKTPLTVEAVALGFIEVADEMMARPIRALTEARGFDTSEHVLACFGGAGGQHACSLANALSISRVVVHRYSSVLSAYGLSLADLVHEVQRPAALEYTSETKTLIATTFNTLEKQASVFLQKQGIASEQIHFEWYLNMRYVGSATAFMILREGDADFLSLFEERHVREFGFKPTGKKVLVDDFRVRGIGSASANVGPSPAEQLRRLEESSCVFVQESSMAKDHAPVCFDSSVGHEETPVYRLTDLKPGARILGPALILDNTQSIVVAPKTKATITETAVVIDMSPPSTTARSTVEPLAKRPKLDTKEVKEQENESDDISINPIQLSIFGHRFMSIAEQMGRTLQKTAVSTNIKERLDFSCALFSPDGGLVANAPHVPVHLGSMQFSVQYQHQHWLGKLRSGDVLVSNHPSCGGTHLPDITVITPVFDDTGKTIIFYVASRGHHADIGGLVPGSMPPTSKHLSEEGAAMEAEKLVSEGVFNEQRMTELLLLKPAEYPGCSGTRCLDDNLSDLKAQVAANHKGVQLVRALVGEHGLDVVHRYMQAIRDTSETAVRSLLTRTWHKAKTPSTTSEDAVQLQSVDYMDDGSRIQLAVQIYQDGSAIFDFDGVGHEVYGNTNAPIAITHSAIIYSLRCMVDSEIPLNQGCLNPITIKIPTGTLLNPSKSASVVAGNVLTSQRIVDTILSAFQACAHSQGCMNNLTFGVGGKDPQTGKHVNGFGYYETIGGGGGAGPSWNGSHCVHTHMTNTRITDPEVLEKRYPCILHRFQRRTGTGGRGRWQGGDGIVREIEFCMDGVSVSVLTERRSRAPQGAEGGEPGCMGENLWVRRRRPEDVQTDEQRVINLGGKATVVMNRGDRILVHTPGGGGFGQLI